VPNCFVYSKLAQSAKFILKFIFQFMSNALFKVTWMLSYVSNVCIRLLLQLLHSEPFCYRETMRVSFYRVSRFERLIMKFEIKISRFDRNNCSPKPWISPLHNTCWKLFHILFCMKNNDKLYITVEYI
jgi:hypothetical protein